MTTPPGWYPEPSQAGQSPTTERWWDGTTWTEYTRRAHAPTPVQDTYRDEAETAAARGRGRGAVVAAGAAAVLVVAAAVVGGVLLLSGDGDGREKPQAAPSASAGAPGAEVGTETFATDRVNGIVLPVPEGWESRTQESGIAHIASGQYPCTSAKSGVCFSAGVYTMPVSAAGSDARAVAEADIRANAEDSYGQLESHRQVKAETVRVAGKEGYLVRWKVDPADGPTGYVQSLAFPSPDTGRLVRVRFGFDDTAKAPDLSVMDEIVRGIRAVDGADGAERGGV